MEQYKLPSHNNPDKVFIVNRSELEGRFDTDYYKPSVISKIRLITEKPYILLSQRIEKLETGFNNNQNFNKHGFPFIRTQNIRPVYLDLLETTYTEDINVRIVPKHTLLFTRIGVGVGDVAINLHDNIAISDNVISATFKSELFAKYVCVYLATNLGNIFINREKRDTARAIISYENIKRIVVPDLAQNIQQQIVNLYEEAYNLKQKKEAEAKVLLDSIDSYLLSELGITLPEKDNSLQKRVFTTQFSEVVGRRLDTNFFLEEFKNIERKIEISTYSAFALKELFHINRGGSPRPINDYFTEDDDGLNWIKIGDTKDDDLYIDSTKQKIIQEGTKYSRKVEIGDFLLSNSMSFGRPYISNIEGYIHDGWLLLRPKEKINNIFMHTLLGSKLMYKLFGKATIGGVVENLNIDLVKQIRIPLPPLEKQNEIAQHIQSIREQAKQLQNDAKVILEQAKQEVELMILG